MKKLLISSLVLITIALMGFTFDSGAIYNETSAKGAWCPAGLTVVCIGTNPANVTAKQNGVVVSTGISGPGTNTSACVNLIGLSAGYYDVSADNGSCDGGTLNVYWPGGDALTKVTVNMDNCYGPQGHGKKKK